MSLSATLQAFTVLLLAAACTAAHSHDQQARAFSSGNFRVFYLVFRVRVRVSFSSGLVLGLGLGFRVSFRVKVSFRFSFRVSF